MFEILIIKKLLHYFKKKKHNKELGFISEFAAAMASLFGST